LFWFFEFVTEVLFDASSLPLPLIPEIPRVQEGVLEKNPFILWIWKYLREGK
jgi:hypothetical protein